MCQKVEKVLFSEYKARTMDDENSTVTCDDCHAKLQVVVERSCAAVGCKNKFELHRFFYEKMGLSMARNCHECRLEVTEVCSLCKESKRMK